MNEVTHKLITCILPKGKGTSAVAALRKEKGIITANVKSARGIGKYTPLAFRGIGAQSEKDILIVPVPAEQADDIFEFLYFQTEINQPHGGIMFQGPLTHLSEYTLPEIADE